MPALWTKPSLSRDFALLVGGILFVLVLASVYVFFQTYETHSERVYHQIETEANRVDQAMDAEMEHASNLVESMGRQISHYDVNDLPRIAELMRSFDKTAIVNNVLSWINADQMNVASSNKGVNPKPVDVSDRDYMKKTITAPWAVQTGRPFLGRVSEKWVIPVAIGVTDDTGKYLGTMLLSMDIDALTREFRGIIGKSGLAFAIYSKNLILLTRSDNSGDGDFINPDAYMIKLRQATLDGKPAGVLTRALPLDGRSFYSYFQTSPSYPYIIVLALDPKQNRRMMLDLLLYRLPPFLFLAIFVCSLLWVIRSRLIAPVIQLTAIASGVARGEPFRPLPQGGPVEVEVLAGEIRKAAEYIRESMRISEEQLGKNVALKRGKESAELSNRIKNEFITAMSHELRTPLNNIIGFSEIIKNEMYGPLDNPQYAQYMHDIYHSSKHLEALVNDILSLSSAEASLAEMQDKAVDVRFVLGKALRQLTDRLQSRRISVETRIPQDLPRLIVDEARLRQIFSNLIGNAGNHTPEGGSIIIQARMEKDARQTDWLAVSFIDYGAKSVQHESEAAGLGHNAGGRRIDMSGLRIPLTKALVAMHQATLEIVSPPGKPTTVTVRFPKTRVVY